MGTFNGAKYIARQVDTIISQQNVSVELLVSDDGSTDETLAILDGFAASGSAIVIRTVAGPREGFAENFRSLLLHASDDFAYTAFSDQDDVWDDDKLDTAIDWLAQQDPSKPALYCSRTCLISDDEKILGYSPIFPRAPNFNNAIVQSIAGANTMVMNRAARRLVAASAARTGFVSHDWWAYLLVTGAGGTVHYSPDAKIRYRQHHGNLVGANAGWFARLIRIKELTRGRFVRWNDRNIAGLVLCEDLLTPDSRETVKSFERVRSEASVFRRIRSLYQLGVYRQTSFGNVGLYAASVLKRL